MAEPAQSHAGSHQDSSQVQASTAVSSPNEQRPGSSSSTSQKEQAKIERWNLGILNDKQTEEVPGTVLLLSVHRNEPLGLQHQPRRRSDSSLPSPYPVQRTSSSSSVVSQKKTPNGRIVLNPQPDESLNDPLNWPALRRDAALLSLGFYCCIGGGMTPVLAAGYSNVSQSFDVTYARVALTTGLYMMGLGVGSVIFSPTAILFGKRPVYLGSAILFVLTSIWCALSPSYASLATARVFQGISVSPVECLPSATIAEIFFLHERAYRIGIYTLLLLGGKNLIPLVSAAIIEAKDWRWVFYVTAIVVGFGGTLLFFLVPETFWDRTPRPRHRRPTAGRRSFSNLLHGLHTLRSHSSKSELPQAGRPLTLRQQRLHDLNAHAHFEGTEGAEPGAATDNETRKIQIPNHVLGFDQAIESPATSPAEQPLDEARVPRLQNLDLPYYPQLENSVDHIGHHKDSEDDLAKVEHDVEKAVETPEPENAAELEKSYSDLSQMVDSPVERKEQNGGRGQPSLESDPPRIVRYTTNLRQAPRRSYSQTLRPWNGRLSRANWLLVACRPFILFAYPAVLWSSLVYALSVGWLIVLSESVSYVYKNRDTYNFSALGVGLVYLSPFIGGILGSAVAGKVSDIVVQYMARRNGGIYEPEFRLVMAIPILLSTATGLIGFGWSAQERDRWIVPTIFFGVISFGCSLGSTTAITFCVDSYRQYAGEALVTLNFSKNILHGLVFSLFFANWLQSDGSKEVFQTIGGIQIACLLTTIPMYIYGKRARMWTVRKGFMEKS